MIIDENKLKRQNQAIQTFINTGSITGKCLGATEGATGFGKTYMALLSTKRFISGGTVHVVVPSNPLKDQWEEKIKEEKISLTCNIEVFIINSYVTQKRSCDYLISDEGHRYSNEDAVVFSTLLDICTYKHAWFLSAKFTKEQLFFLSNKGIEIIDRIPVEECRKNGWVSNYKIYNLPVNLTNEEQNIYIQSNNIMKAHFPYFDGNLKLVYSLMKDKAKMKAYCDENGYDIKEMGMRGANLNKALSKRKAVVFNAYNKKQAVIDIIEHYPNKKCIVFAQTIKFADECRKLVGNSTIYHSNLKLDQKRKALEGIKSGKYTSIFSAKALQEGLDVEDLELGIAISYTSTEREAIQTLGRVIRYTIASKMAIFINLYCEDTMELGWLKARQKSFINIHWIKNIGEIMEI